MYEFRFCREDEAGKLQEFIDKVWKKNHILARDLKLLKWQNFNKERNDFNYIVAYNSNTDNFDAVLGFIFTSHFNPALIDQKDVWLVVWKANLDTAERKGLGLELLFYIQKEFEPTSISAIGNSDIADKIYRAAGFTTGILNQYYFLHPDISQFNLVQLADEFKREGSISSSSPYTLKEIINLNEYKDLQTVYRPKKSIEYLKARYTNHPSYVYKFYGVFDQDKILFIMVVRSIKQDDSTCLRIVDIYGSIEKLNSIESEINKLLKTTGAEFIDCLNFGINEENFYSLGFTKRDNTLIIPNYFEPYERRNVDVKFAYKSEYSDFVIFKGDSDQDRPNM